jgi:hypothetical protein
MPISLAFATAASTIFCASAEEILCLFTILAIADLPPLDMYCLLIIPAIRAIEAAFPVLRNYLAEMDVAALSSIKLAVTNLDAMIQSVNLPQVGICSAISSTRSG